MAPQVLVKQTQCSTLPWLLSHRSLLDTAIQSKAKYLLLGCWDFNFLPTNGFSIKPLKVKRFAGEQKATKTKYLPDKTRDHHDFNNHDAEDDL